MNKIINCIKSLIEIIRLNLKAENPTIIFYYPQHFNRSKRGDNDFLKPLIDSCNKNDISYLVFEEPAETIFPRSKKAIKFDFVFFLVIVLRRLLSLKNYNNFEEREWRISKILKPIFFRNLNPKTVITMSNSMLGFYRGWGNDINIYDYQHGIIYASHPGYVANQKPVNHILYNRSKVLLYGDGFKQLLVNLADGFFIEQAKIIGSLVNYQNIHQKFNGNLLVTMPFVTRDDITPLQTLLLKQLEQIFIDNKDFYIENNIHFYLKHHPRFDESVDISSILVFSFVHVIEKTLSGCFNECSVHLTFNSTTTFDAAIVGIPTLFLGSLENNLLFNEEFKYPDFEVNLNVKESIERFLTETPYYAVQSIKAQNWAKLFYQPFDEREFLKLLHEKN